VGSAFGGVNHPLPGNLAIDQLGHHIRQLS